jgi:hypothetical protein
MKSHHAHTKSRMRGVTLVELLVVLGVLGFLTILASSYLSLGAGTWQRVNAKVSREDAISSAQRLLRQVLTQAYPPTTKQDGAAISAFDGQPEALTFEGFPSSAMKTKPIARMVLALEQSHNAPSKRLIMKWRANDQRESTSVLLDRISAARFAYYDRDEDRWLPAWTGQATLPAAIRLDVTFEGERENQRAWPQFVVNPMLTASATCLYDPGTQSCRE